MQYAEVIVGATAAAGFTALGTAIVSWVKTGNRLTALETRQDNHGDSLNRIEDKVDEVLLLVAGKKVEHRESSNLRPRR